MHGRLLADISSTGTLYHLNRKQWENQSNPRISNRKQGDGCDGERNFWQHEMMSSSEFSQKMDSEDVCSGCKSGISNSISFPKLYIMSQEVSLNARLELKRFIMIS